MKIHRILVTNDDGITAPGIAILEKIARTLSDEVWVVAPDFERSGASRSVSLADPIRVRKIDDFHYSLLRGTPADCATVALNSLMQSAPPDLVLSGVNRGSNLAEDLTYSGTIAAAMEACTQGIRAIALSQVFAPGQTVRWHTAEHHATRIIRALLDLEAAPGVFHNINFPDVEPAEVRGARAVPAGRWAKIKLNVNDRIDARSFPYAWLSFTHEPGHSPDENTDIGAAYGGWISVTPLHTDITYHRGLDLLHDRLSKL